MRRYATSACGLKLLVYAALSYLVRLVLLMRLLRLRESQGGLHWRVMCLMCLLLRVRLEPLVYPALTY